MVLRFCGDACYNKGRLLKKGRLAQLGERHVRNVEAVGSTPIPSTYFFPLTINFLASSAAKRTSANGIRTSHICAAIGEVANISFPHGW